MVTIICVKYLDKPRLYCNEDETETDATEKEILINIDSPLGLILNYIREVAELDGELDLCDEINCQVRNIGELDLCARGTDIFEPRGTYYLITYKRDSNGQILNVMPNVNPNTAKKYSEILMKVRKSFKKGSSTKIRSKKKNSVGRSTT